MVSLEATAHINGDTFPFYSKLVQATNAVKNQKKEPWARLTNVCFYHFVSTKKPNQAEKQRFIMHFISDDVVNWCQYKQYTYDFFNGFSFKGCTDTFQQKFHCHLNHINFVFSEFCEKVDFFFKHCTSKAIRITSKLNGSDNKF